jgi:dephospho-CoA kinase
MLTMSNPPNKASAPMRVVGLTGPTGSGKSTVSKILSGWKGVSVIDCDQLSRRVVHQGSLCLMELALEFSSAIIDAHGELNRRKLASIVFGHPAKLSRLNAIIFPHILQEIDVELEKARKNGTRLAVIDAPTLFESGADQKCDEVIVVIAKPEIRLQRILARDGITPQEAARRMESQSENEFYEQHADYLIQNDTDPIALRLAVVELLNHLGL